MIYGYIDNDVNELLTEAVCKGNIQGWGDCTIEVYGNEGTIPHIHIKSKDKSKEACICLFEPKGFIHGSDNKYIQLDKKAQKDLDKLLSKPSSKANKSNWEFAVDIWSEKSGDKIWEHKDDYKDIKQPDYSNIKGERVAKKN